MSQNPDSFNTPGSIPSAPAAPLKKTSFSIHWSAWLCALFAGIIVVAAHALTSNERLEDRFGVCVGLLLGMLFLAFIPALIAFYAGRRSRFAATVTFIVFLALGALGQVGAATTRMMKARNHGALWDEIARVQTDMKRQVASGTFDQDKAVEAAKKLSSALEKESQSSPEDAALLRSMSTVMQQLASAGVSYSESLKALIGESPLNPGWVKVQRDLERCRKHVADIQARSDEFRVIYANIGVRLASELEKNGVPRRKAEDCVAGFTSKFTLNKAIFESIRDDDDQMVKVLQMVIDILDRTWGMWRFSTEAGMVVFDSPETLKEYQELSGQFQAVAKHQETQQVQFQANLTGPAK